MTRLIKKAQFSVLGLLLLSCATGTVVPPTVTETCMNELGCEPDCFMDTDCGEAQRCVEGLCYDNECELGESRPCEGTCGRGTQQCLGGIWRTCSAESASPEGCLAGGTKAGQEVGGDMSGGAAGGEAGGVAGGETGGIDGGETGGGGVMTERCDPSWTEVCTDMIDQDCDGQVDEGCGECVLPYDGPVENPADELGRFSDEFGYVKLNRMGVVRRAVISKERVTSRPVLYGLGTTGDLIYRTAGQLEQGAVIQLFPLGTQIGALMRDSSGLKLIMSSVNGDTDHLRRVTSATTSEEAVYADADFVSVAWTEGGDVKLQTFSTSALSPQGGARSISDAPYRSGASAITQTAQRLTVAFEDERNQGSAPELMLGGVNPDGSVSTAVSVTEGYAPLLVWTDGALYMVFMRALSGRTQLLMATLDPSTFSMPHPPQVIYESSLELKPISLTRSSGEELVLAFQELSVGLTAPQHLKLLYLNREGRVSRGPFLIQSLPSRSSLSSSDVFYDPAREELVTGWMETGRVEGDSFTFQFMQVIKSDLTALPPCATAP